MKQRNAAQSHFPFGFSKLIALYKDICDSEEKFSDKLLALF